LGRTDLVNEDHEKDFKISYTDNLKVWVYKSTLLPFPRARFHSVWLSSDLSYVWVQTKGGLVCATKELDDGKRCPAGPLQSGEAHNHLPLTTNQRLDVLLLLNVRYYVIRKGRFDPAFETRPTGQAPGNTSLWRNAVAWLYRRFLSAHVPLERLSALFFSEDDDYKTYSFWHKTLRQSVHSCNSALLGDLCYSSLSNATNRCQPLLPVSYSLLTNWQAHKPWKMLRREATFSSNSFSQLTTRYLHLCHPSNFTSR
jgi:hypothetical protein